MEDSVVTTGLLLIKTSRRNMLYKAGNYTVRVSGQPDEQLTEQQLAIQYNLPSGRYTVEVSDEQTTVSNEVVVLMGKPRVLRVNPRMSLAMFRGVIVGIVFTLALLRYIVTDKPPSFLPFLPLLLLLSRKDKPDFNIAISR